MGVSSVFLKKKKKVAVVIRWIELLTPLISLIGRIVLSSITLEADIIVTDY